MIVAAGADRPRCFGLDVDLAKMPSPEGAQRFVATALDRFRPDWKTLAPYVRFSSECYGRNLLYRDERLEILLLCWLPGQKTPIHDHGASWGVSAAINGDLIETSYRRDREGAPLVVTESRVMQAGSVAFESSDTIHQVENVSSSPLMSLHIYGPPLARFGTYDALTGERRVVVPAIASAPPL